MKLPAHTMSPISGSRNSVLPITEAQGCAIILDSPSPVRQSTLLSLPSEYIQGLFLNHFCSFHYYLHPRSLPPGLFAVASDPVFLFPPLCSPVSFWAGRDTTPPFEEQVEDLNRVCSLTSSSTTCPLAPFPPDTLVFPSHIKYSPLGPLYVCSLCRECSSFTWPCGLLPYFLRDSSQMWAHPKKPDLTTLYKTAPTSYCLPPSHLALLCFCSQHLPPLTIHMCVCFLYVSSITWTVVGTQYNISWMNDDDTNRDVCGSWISYTAVVRKMGIGTCGVVMAVAHHPVVNKDLNTSIKQKRKWTTSNLLNFKPNGIPLF